MATHSILDEAEQRVGSAATTAHTGRQAEIEAMRLEIGPQHYTQAPVELARLEKFIGAEILPFVAQLRAIEHRSERPLPQPMQAHLKEIDTVIHLVPNTIRTGLQAWDALQPPVWAMDGKSIDSNARAAIINQIRFCLRNWDGVRGRLSDLRSYVEQYIRESNYPAGQPGAAA